MKSVIRKGTMKIKKLKSQLRPRKFPRFSQILLSWWTDGRRRHHQHQIDAVRTKIILFRLYPPLPLGSQ